jgi:hypothetical protein
MLRELIQQRPTGNVKPIKVADKDDEMVVFGEAAGVAQNPIELCRTGSSSVIRPQRTIHLFDRVKNRHGSRFAARRPEFDLIFIVEYDRARLIPLRKDLP